jgi:hypothetical protein
MITGIYVKYVFLCLFQLNDALAVEATAYALLTEYLVEGGGITIVQGFAGTPLVNFRDLTTSYWSVQNHGPEGTCGMPLVNLLD